MGAVSSPELAVAVAEAGALGSVTTLGMSAGQVDKLLSRMTSRTSGSLAANFLTADVDHETVAAAAGRVRVVDFFWSYPDAALVELVHRHGAIASWQVGSLDEAHAAVDAGCDMVAVQGTEAGGHVRGDAALLPLLGAVLDQVSVPVLAAGGIGSGRALAAVLAAGAAGARIGTRFIATMESGAHPEYKKAVVGAGLGATEITGAFAVCPLCATRPRARVLSCCVRSANALPDGSVGETRVGDQTIEVPKGYGMPPSAGTSGRVEAMAMYASDSAADITRIEPAADVLAALVASAERQLDHSPRR